MQLQNDTPFATMFFESVDEVDRPINVAILRGTFDITSDGTLTVANEQTPVVMADEYYDQPLTSSIRVDTDLVPKKYHTDITLEAVAHAPNAKPQEAWEVSVSIGNLCKRLRVTGPRCWNHKLFGWTLTRPEPCLKVPIRYEHAYGGTYRRYDQEVRYEQNPVGRGFVDLSHIDRNVPVLAPQIESLEEPVREIDRPYRAAGFGPIPKHCLPRRSLCGTPDAKWKEQRWPMRPLDFDFNYYNCAADGLRCNGFLKGNEPIVLHHLTDDGDLRFELPGLDQSIFAIDASGEFFVEPLILDTLHINATKQQVSLTWRATYLKKADPRMVVLSEG